MLDYVYGHDETVARFVSGLIPRFQGRQFDASAKAIGIVDGEGKLIAGVVYHNYDPPSQTIEISGAALPGRFWISRETLKRSYQYPFHTCGCQMVVQRNDAEDTRLLRQLADLNYMFIRVPRALGRDRDGVLCLLTYEDWAANRFCRKYHHHIPDHELRSEAA